MLLGQHILGELFEVMVIVAPGEDVLDEPREED